MKDKIANKEYFNKINPSTINEILADASFRKELISHKNRFSDFLKYYLILTYGGKRIPFLPDDILYTSRYYWLKLFYHYYSNESGTDAGIEQQIGSLIEEMANKLIDYDWNILEEISREISQCQ